MERRRRLLVLAAIAVLALPLPSGARGGAPAVVPRDRALAEAFPGARVEPRAFVLGDEQLKEVRRRARVRTDARAVTAHVAWRGDTLVGVGFFDQRVVRTLPGVFLIVVAPDSTVARVDVVAFHEPSDYRPTPRWLGLFGRRRLDERLWPRRDIRQLAGATLTTQAVTEGVRWALAVYQVVVAPDLARRPHGETR